MTVLYWVLIALGLAVVEILTVTFFPIFFAASALIAMVVLLLGGPDWAQWAAFGLAGLVLSGALRPLAQRQLAKGPTLKSAVESVVGRAAVVQVAIDGRAGTGTVLVEGGEVWSAAPAGDAFGQIPSGSDVEVQEIRGATLVVAPVTSAGVR